MPVGGKGSPAVLRQDPVATDPGVVVRGVGGGFGGVIAVDATAMNDVAVGSVTPATVFVANSSRKAFQIQASWANTDVVYVAEGDGASSTVRVCELQPGGVYVPLVNYRGKVTALAASGTQHLAATEY